MLCEILLWDREGLGHWQDMALQSTLTMVRGAGKSKCKVRVKTLSAFLARTLFSPEAENQLPAHTLHRLPCIVHWHDFLIDNLSKRCHLSIESTPRKAKTCVASTAEGSLSLEGSSSWLGQTQSSLLRTKG